MTSRPSLGPKQLRLTAAAERDLDNIAQHLAEEAGFDVAIRYADYLDAELTKLAALGHSGVSRAWIRPGLRLHVIGNYSVYFRTTEADTIVLRILHGHMDVEAIGFDDADEDDTAGPSSQP